VKLGRSKLYLLDHLAHWADRVGDFLSAPFFRLGRWAADRWWAEQRVTCHFCGLPIAPGEKKIQAKTGNAWAHVTCWYDGSAFERDVRDLERRRA
jgi:hypothetical protein